MKVTGQSWSIALELYFYLLVPFILPRSTAVILGLAALSVMARIVTFAFGFDSVNFVYAAFPFELATFQLERWHAAFIFPTGNSWKGIWGCRGVARHLRDAGRRELRRVAARKRL